MRLLIIFILTLNLATAFSVSPPELILEDYKGIIFVNENNLTFQGENFNFKQNGNLAEVSIIDNHICNGKITILNNNQIQSGIEINVINPDCKPKIINLYLIPLIILVLGLIISKLMRII